MMTFPAAQYVSLNKFSMNFRIAKKSYVVSILSISQIHALRQTSMMKFHSTLISLVSRSISN